MNQSDKIEKNFLLQRNNLEKRGKELIGSIEHDLIKKSGLVIQDTTVEIGSGSLPNKIISSVGLCFKNTDAEKLASIFRQQPVPVIGYIRDNQFILDLKAVLEEDFDILKQEVAAVLNLYYA